MALPRRRDCDHRLSRHYQLYVWALDDALEQVAFDSALMRLCREIETHVIDVLRELGVSSREAASNIAAFSVVSRGVGDIFESKVEEPPN